MISLPSGKESLLPGIDSKNAPIAECFLSFNPRFSPGGKEEPRKIKCPPHF
jgi:hypothetical protein